MTETYRKLFDQTMEEHDFTGMLPTEIEAFIETSLTNFIENNSTSFMIALQSNFEKEAKKQRKIVHKFEKRNYARWKEGFDLLLLMLELSTNIGEVAKQEVGIQNGKGVFFRLQAGIYLHARGLLVSREILTLMKSGHADGALGRWRTLHEVATVSSFIATTSEEIAERFFESRAIKSWKAAIQYTEYQDRANLTPFDKEELELLETEYQRVLKKYGKEIKSDYGWAAPAFGHDRITFFDIEKHQNLDHWRPRYKWASQDTHANFRPIPKTLAMSEATEDMLLIGASNSGMTDPGQMLGCSLVLLNSALLSLEKNADMMVRLKTLQNLNDQVYSEFSIGEERNNVRGAKSKIIL